MATEDFDRERLGRRAAEGLASLSPVVNGWARDLQSALSEVERLLDALRAIDALPIDGAFMSDTLAIVEAALTGSPVEGTR